MGRRGRREPCVQDRGSVTQGLLHWRIVGPGGEGGGMMLRRCRPVPAVSNSAFKGFRFPPEIIVLAVRWFVQDGTRRSGPPTPRSDGDLRSMQLTSYRRGIDIERQGDFGEGVASAVATGGLADVVRAHLAAVHSSRDAACFEVGGDGPVVDAELAGKIGQRPSCLVLAHELVDLDLVQATLDPAARRV